MLFCYSTAFMIFLVTFASSLGNLKFRQCELPPDRVKNKNNCSKNYTKGINNRANWKDKLGEDLKRLQLSFLVNML